MAGTIEPGMGQIFLSHTTTDKPIVNRFSEALRHYDDFKCWLDTDRLFPGDDLLTMITEAVSASSHVIVFWSQNAFQKYESKKGVGDLSWLALEIRTAIAALLRLNRKPIFVRLDDSEFPNELVALFSWSLRIEAIGLLDSSRFDHDLIVWRAANSIVGTIRGRNPLYPPLDMHLNRNGKPVTKARRSFLNYTWVGGTGGNRSGSNYIESLDIYIKKELRGTLVPAVKGDDGGLAYRFSIPSHTAGGWWYAKIFFGPADVGWRTVDLSEYREMRFNARAGNTGAPLCVSFVDNQVSPKAPGHYHETSMQLFTLGNFWRSGSPWILKLDDLDWTAKGYQWNIESVDRGNVNAITLGNGGQTWEPGARWVELKNIVFL
jgi:TIR domain